MLKLKVGTNPMVTVNIDIQDHIIKAQTGIIGDVEYPQGSVCKVYAKFSDKLAQKQWDHLI